MKTDHFLGDVVNVVAFQPLLEGILKVLSYHLTTPEYQI